MKVKADKSPGFLLWQAANQWQKELNKVLKIKDLTHAQFILLSNLYRLEQEREKVSLASLSIVACTDLMMTSQVVRTLVNKGLVIRQNDPKDRRACILQTTPKGRKTSQEATSIVKNEDGKFFQRISCINDFINNLNLLVGHD